MRQQKTDDRLAWIDYQMSKGKAVSRMELAERFQISDAMASLVLKKYIKLYPGQARYDFSKQKHVPNAGFTPKFGPYPSEGIAKIIKADTDKEGYRCEIEPINGTIGVIIYDN